MSESFSTGDGYKVRDLDLASRGRMKIDWAESRMPVMMALREEHAKLQSLKGMRVAGCLHVTKETAVLVETLKAAGADLVTIHIEVQPNPTAAAAAAPRRSPAPPRGSRTAARGPSRARRGGRTRGGYPARAHPAAGVPARPAGRRNCRHRYRSRGE